VWGGLHSGPDCGGALSLEVILGHDIVAFGEEAFHSMWGIQAFKAGEAGPNAGGGGAVVRKTTLSPPLPEKILARGN